MARRNELDDRYAINAAKTELREGYNNADVERILSVYADAFTDMSDRQASFFGARAIEHRSAMTALLEVKLHSSFKLQLDVFVDGSVSCGVNIISLHTASCVYLAYGLTP